MKLEPSLAISQRKVKPPVENTKSIIKRSIAIENKNKNTIAIGSKTISQDQEDAIIHQAEDLINNNKFRPFFFKTLKIIGPEAFYEAMDWARKTDAQCQPCMFVKRLKLYRDAAA